MWESDTINGIQGGSGSWSEVCISISHSWLSTTAHDSLLSRRYVPSQGRFNMRLCEMTCFWIRLCHLSSGSSRCVRSSLQHPPGGQPVPDHVSFIYSPFLRIGNWAPRRRPRAWNHCCAAWGQPALLWCNDSRTWWQSLPTWVAVILDDAMSECWKLPVRGRVPPRVIPTGGISHESPKGAISHKDIPPKYR